MLCAAVLAPFRLHTHFAIPPPGSAKEFAQKPKVKACDTCHSCRAPKWYLPTDHSPRRAFASSFHLLQLKIGEGLRRSDRQLAPLGPKKRAMSLASWSRPTGRPSAGTGGRCVPVPPAAAACHPAGPGPRRPGEASPGWHVKPAAPPSMVRLSV